MSRTARLWKGAGLLTLGGMLLSGVVARGDDGPPLAVQLTDLGRQAWAQGSGAMAQTFYQKALQLDPTNVARQQLTSDVEQRRQAARAQVAAGQPEAALNNLRLAQNVVRSATNVPENARRALDQRIQAQILNTVRDEERIVSERAERQRL